MTTKDYQRKSPLMIFLSYFKNHKKLFAIDVSCAVGIALIDLAFPLVTRSALYDMLPNQMYRTFFIVMATVVASYLLGPLLVLNPDFSRWLLGRIGWNGEVLPFEEDLRRSYLQQLKEYQRNDLEMD